MRANCGRCLACSSLGRSVEVMVVLRREIARQSADLFGKFDQHIREVIALAAGDGRHFDRRAVWQFGFAWQNHHAVFYCAFVTHGTKKRGWFPSRAVFSFPPNWHLLVIHSAHAFWAVAGGSFLFLLRHFGDEAFGREQQTGDRSRVLQRSTGDLLRINHASFPEVFVFTRRDVVTVVALALLHFLDHDAAFHAAVVGEFAERALDGALHDVHANLFVVVRAADLVNGFD